MVQLHNGRIMSMQVGRPKPVQIGSRTVQTAFWKEPATEPLSLTRLNFAGDEQADLENHGGPDKAVCVYPFEHYAFWGKELGGVPPLGAFGENVTVAGLVEADVCIGDVFRLGESVVQISQPRQPCYKLARRHGRPDLPEKVQQTGYTGYYFRVLEEGTVAPGAAIEQLERHPAGITVAFANRIKYLERHNLEAVRRILAIAELSASWRASFGKRLQDTTD